MTVAEIMEAVKNLKVLELAELVKALEEEFGVSAMPVAVASGAGAAAGEAVAEQTEFDVELTDVGSSKVNVIKVIRAVTGLGLKEAKEKADNAPSVIKEAASKEDAESIKAQLEEAGAKVTLK